MDNMFLKPEKPFLLILSNKKQEVEIFWCETEEDAMDTFNKYQKNFPDVGFFIDTFIEIGSYREVDLEPTSKTEEALQKCFTFMSEASKVIIDSDTSYEFICPLCGGKAACIKASINGHIHAACEGCGMKIMQ